VTAAKASVNGTNNTTTKHEIDMTHGNIFLPRGNIVFEAGFAVLVVDYDVSNFAQTTADIRTYLTHVNTAIAKYQQHVLKNKDLIPFFHSLTQKTMYMMSQNSKIRNDISDILVSYSPVITNVTVSGPLRNKRFIFPALLLDWIIKVFDLNEGTDPSNSEHTTAAEQTLIHMKRMEFYQKHFLEIQSLMVPLHIAELHLLQFIYQLNNIEVALVSLYTHLNKLRAMINTIAQNKVTHDLISVSLFFDMLLDMQTLALRKNLQFYHTLSKNNLASFYQIAVPRAEYINDTILRVAIMIPLVSINTTYQTTQLLKIPTFLSNSTTSATYNYEGKYLISNNLTFVIYSDEKLAACRFNSPRLCPRCNARKTIQYPTCEMALFLQNENFIAEQCQIIINFNTPPFFKLISPLTNTWAYSVSHPLEFMTKCFDINTPIMHAIVLEHSGIFSLPAGCHFISTHIHLYSHNIITKHVSSRSDNFVTPIYFYASFGHIIEQQLLNATENLNLNLQNLSTTYGLSEEIDLTSLIELLEEERKIAAAKHFNKPWYQRFTDTLATILETISYAIIYSIASLLALTLCWRCLLYVLKKRRSRTQAGDSI
jgi:hypothetical protein